MSIYQYLIGVCFILPKSLSVVGSSRVGYYLGKMDIENAKIASVVTPFLSLLQSLIQSIVVFVCRHKIGMLYTNDIGVINMLGNSLLLVLSVYVIADSVQGCFTGVLGGMGKQEIAGPVVFFCYYLIAIPIAFLLSSTKHGFGLKVLGLIIGVTIGTFVHAGVYCYILYKTNWENIMITINNDTIINEKQNEILQNQIYSSVSQNDNDKLNDSELDELNDNNFNKSSNFREIEIV